MSSKGLKTTQATFTCPVPLWDEIKALAAAERRSYSQTVVLLIEEALQSRNEVEVKE